MSSIILFFICFSFYISAVEIDSSRVTASTNLKKSNIKRDQRFKLPNLKKVQPRKQIKKLDLKSVRPSSSKIYYGEDSPEAELEEVMIEEENQLFRLLKRKKNAELTLRLGALYVERARLIAFKIQSDYEKKLQDFKSGIRSTKPYLNLKPAQVYNRKSLKLFEDFKRSYPNHKRMDEVLFFLGFNFYQLKDKKQGIKYYTELEQRFPKSFYLYETRFQLAEHYFQLRNWKKSLYYYNKVSQNKRGKFYFFSLYKRAWSLYKLNQADKGLAVLKRIIEESRDFQNVSDRYQTFTFTAEATEDLVLFYTFSKKDPANAKSFFLSLLEEDMAWTLLKKLAYAYRDTGQSKGVLILFQNLIDQDPSGKEAFDFKHQMVETVYNLGSVSNILRIIKEWVIDYGPNSSWVQANRRNTKLVKRANSFQEVTIRNYTLKNHDTFRRNRSAKSKELAINFYKIYFDYFKNSAFLDEMYFWNAELLFDSKKYISAVKAYEEVISLFPNSKYTKSAYLNQVLALEKALPNDNFIKKIVGKETQAVEIPRIIRSFLKVSDRYITKFPRAKNTPSVLYTMAALYYKFNHFSKAAQFFRQLSDQYPTHKLASGVRAILLDIYNKNRDYKALEELALSLAQNKTVDKDLLKEVNSVLEQIAFKKAQDLSIDKQYKESALLYEKFARSKPSSPLAMTAFYNAGLNFEKAGDSLRAVSMYSSVLTYKDKNNQKARKKSQEFLAILYEKLGFYKRSADAYVVFAKNYPKDSKSSDFWYNAGVIFDALNDVPSAVYSYGRYFALSKKPDRHEIFYFIAELYGRNKNWNLAISNYNQYIKSPSTKALRVIKASFTVAEIYEKKIRNLNQAHTWYQKTLGLYRSLKTGVSYGARAHFYIVKKSSYDKFQRLNIPSNPVKQKQAIEKKLRFLKDLEVALKPIIRYNDGEQIIASLSLIGLANQEMAKAIYNAPLPKGLNKKEQAQYKEGIKKAIEPYIQKSLEHYRLAIEKSSKIKVYSEWISKAYKGLAEIQLKDRKFSHFAPSLLFQEVLYLPLIDNTGTVTGRFLSSLAKNLKAGLSRSDFVKLSEALDTKNENKVLQAVSSILNKDPNNLATINSLAVFYLERNRLGLAELILNRLADQDDSNLPIINNLAVISLKYGKPRLAMTYLNKILSIDRSYHIGKINLANIFIRNYDYRNAYVLYEKSQNDDDVRETVQEKYTFILNNYGIALTGVKKWESAETVFNRLIKNQSPLSESLFNYSCFLAEKSKKERRQQAQRNLVKARDILEELKVYQLKSSLKRKLPMALKSLSLLSKKFKQSNKVVRKKRSKR
ncbi:MAG: tetratricopeptide repeat protein [Bdellovibrionaceae bacterium]|nr:tetratricopeptide repeat protein [Pseudobdellovibrionaceae bacterium]